MKKFLLTALVLSITATTAQAYNEVRFFNGQPVGNTNFGSNAAFTPENRIRAGQRNRQIQYEKAIIHSIKNQNNYNININNSKNQTDIDEIKKIDTPELTDIPTPEVNKDLKKIKKEVKQNVKGVTYYQY